MKKIVALCIAIILIFIGCSSKNEQQVKEIDKPVKVMTVKNVDGNKMIEYFGFVNSQDIIKLAFKSTGKLEKVNVSVGQKISEGDVLTSLDKSDLNIALKAAKANAEAAKAQYEKAVNGATEEERNQVKSKVEQAKATLDYAEDNYNKIKNLYEQGSISKSDYDKAKLEYDIRKNDYNVAIEAQNTVLNGARKEDKVALKEQSNQAKADYEHKLSLVKDADMVSKIDGSVVEILYKEGELVPQGYPVVVIKGDEKIVETGVVAKDVNKLTVDDKCLIKVDDKYIDGRIITVSNVPSIDSRVFKVEIALENDSDVNIGDTVDVEFIVGKEKSIWIPLSSIMSTEIDYVYRVKDARVEKVKIDIVYTKGTDAKVSGLEDGDVIVIEGMKNLRLGDKVKVFK